MSRLLFENPFRAPGRWWKGNLHTHTNVSDGTFSPRKTAQLYRKLGYDFLAITDHRTFAEWFEPPEGLLIVPGAEYDTYGFDPSRVWHIVGLGVTGEITGVGGPVEALWENIRENSRFHFVAHPYWSNLSEDDALALEGLPAMEVFNGVCEVLRDKGFSEQAWDYALGGGRRMNALATDDGHAEAHFGRGWIVLRAEELTLGSLFDALDRGLYYSTCGPEIHDLAVTENTVCVRCSPCVSVRFMAKGPRGKNIVASAGSTMESAEYTIEGTERYVRVQVEDANGRRAYSNPIYLDESSQAED